MYSPPILPTNPLNAPFRPIVQLRRGSEAFVLQDYLTKKKMEKERGQMEKEWANAEPPIKEVSEQISQPGQEQEEQEQDHYEEQHEQEQDHEHEQELTGLTPEHSMLGSEHSMARSEHSLARSEHSIARSEASNGVHRVVSSPRSDLFSLGDSFPRVGTPRVMESPSVALPSIKPKVATPPTSGLRLAHATVKSVVSVGEGDRVSVDLCNLLNPGEAMLVGSFSKGMFLVHSEVQANNTSRKSFRVNAVSNHLCLHILFKTLNPRVGRLR